MEKVGVLENKYLFINCACVRRNFQRGKPHRHFLVTCECAVQLCRSATFVQTDLRYGEFYHKYCGETKLIIDLVKDYDLILSNLDCPKCNRPC